MHRQKQKQKQKQQQQQREQQQRQPATAGSDVCERYRYLREGICVELAYNRRADLLIRNPAVLLTRVPRAVFSARTQYLVAVSSPWPFPPFWLPWDPNAARYAIPLKIRVRFPAQIFPSPRLATASLAQPRQFVAR